MSDAASASRDNVIHSCTESVAQKIPPGKTTARGVTLLERVLLIGGIALFLILLYQIGVEAVWENIGLIGWGFILTIGQEMGAIICNTFGWRLAFSRPRPDISFWRLSCARLAGDAINNVTPTATVGGEVVRARMLHGEVESNVAWAGTAVAKVSQTVSQLAFIVIGLLFVLKDTPLPAGVQRGLIVGLGVIGIGTVIAMVLQKRGMFTLGLRMARRLGVPVPTSLDQQLTHLDEEIALFYRAPWAFIASASYFFVGWMFGVVEIYLLLLFLHLNAGWHRALTIEVLSVAIDAILFFVPAKAGTQEGGKVLIFSILQLDPAKGLALGIARRIRELTWSFVGLVLFSRYQARTGNVRARPREPASRQPPPDREPASLVAHDRPAGPRE